MKRNMFDTSEELILGIRILVLICHQSLPSSINRTNVEMSAPKLTSVS